MYSKKQPESSEKLPPITHAKWQWNSINSTELVEFNQNFLFQTYTRIQLLLLKISPFN